MNQIQARGRRRWLLRYESKIPNQRKFQLKPDILFQSHGNDAHLIIDTKWKILSESGEFESKKISTSDLYQLYAYANRYECNDNVLLYPKTEGTQKKSFAIEESDGKKIRIEFINVSRNIRKNKMAFNSELMGIIN